MNKDNKICKKHGYISGNDVRWEKSGKQGLVLRCVKCKLEKDNRYKEKNRKILCEKNKEYKKNNRDIVNTWNRKDRARDPKKHAAWSKKYKDANRDAIRKQEICRIHKISIEQYEKMITDHNNVCAICKQPESRKRRSEGVMPLTVDHCHVRSNSKKHHVRGLLCHQCNLMIGYAKDSPEILESAIKYIKFYQ